MTSLISKVNVHKQNMNEGVQHDFKQCDECSHRAALSSNVNVHKQTLHEGIPT